MLQSAQLGVEFKLVKITHDLGSWKTKPSEITTEKSVLKMLNLSKKYDKKNIVGYLDLQLMWDKYNRPPSLMFGGGFGSTNHTDEERIDLNNYQKTIDFFTKIME
jgi:di/tripeptidase